MGGTRPSGPDLGGGAVPHRLDVPNRVQAAARRLLAVSELHADVAELRDGFFGPVEPGQHGDEFGDCRNGDGFDRSALRVTRRLFLLALPRQGPQVPVLPDPVDAVHPRRGDRTAILSDVPLARTSGYADCADHRQPCDRHPLRDLDD